MPASPSHPGADQFTAAAQRVVDYLSVHTPLRNWSVTRVSGGEQVHVHVHGNDLIPLGTRIEWADSFCIRMLAGAASTVADSTLDPDYAPLQDSTPVRSYSGVQLADDRGELFGTLCGFNTDPLVDVDQVDVDLVALMGRLLSAQLATARAADHHTRVAKDAEAMAQIDQLTGLANRRAWDAWVEDAQARIDAYGDLVAIAVIDLDDLKATNDEHGHRAGDDLLARTGATLTAAAADEDRVARYGGDEFVVLAENVAPDDVEAHFARYARALAISDIRASMGVAAATPGAASMTEAFAAADHAMYETKLHH